MLELPDTTLLAVDFDYSFAHFTGGVGGLTGIFTPYGVPLDVAAQALNVAEAEGFTIGHYREVVEEMSGVRAPLEEVEEQFAAWLRTNLRLYEDVGAALQRWQDIGLPVHVVTFGNDGYQRQKIAMVSLEVVGVTVVTEGNKIPALTTLLGSHKQIVFVDDNPKELDAVHSHGLSNRVTTVRIMRTDSPYYGQEARYEHRIANSLTDINWKE